MKIDINSHNLAINGGTPIRSEIWKDNFTTDEEEKKAVNRVLDSGYLSLFEGSHTPDYPFKFTGGPEVMGLEDEWSQFYKINYSISMNSATSGLFASIGALGIGYGDEVIVSPFTMTACAMAPLIYGAIPVFADVELETGCLDPLSIEKLISKRTKAIIIVHQFGFPANMEKILEIAKKNNIKIIEDCAQAHAAKFNGKYVGTFGDIGVFSLNVNKTIQAGEGCVCVTNDKDLAYRLQLIRNHGEAVVGPAKYKNITNIAGFNYRMTEVTAAIARVQLKKLPKLNDKRLSLVKKFEDSLKKYDFISVFEGRKSDNSNKILPQGIHSTFYVVPIRFQETKAFLKREKFVEIVNCEGALFYQGYTKPLYYQPVFQEKKLFKNGYPFCANENKNSNFNYYPGSCPNAETLHFKEIIINEHIRPPQTEEDIDQLIKIIEKVCC